MERVVRIKKATTEINSYFLSLKGEAMTISFHMPLVKLLGGIRRL
jgi:hypothetical protein